MGPVKVGAAASRGRRFVSSPAGSAFARASRRSPPSAERLLDEVESVARIGSYALDIASGRWVSSKRLDAIYGIDAGYERSVEGWSWLVHPAEREAMVAYFTDEVLGRSRPFDRQYRIVRADTGEERWVHGRGALDLDPSGRPLRMLGTIADITEQVVAERERARLVEGLRRSERNLAEAQRIAHIGSWERDLASGSLRWSDESHRMFGIEPGTFAGTQEAYLAFVHPDDRSKALPSLARLKAGDPGTTDYRIIRADGAVRILREVAEVIRDPRGTPVRYVGSTQDITEQAAAEEERTRLEEGLRQSERSLAEAQRIAGIGSWDWDLTTGLSRRSPEMYRILGVEGNAIAGTDEAFMAFVHPDDRGRVQASERAAVSGTGDYVLQYRAVRPDGAVRIVHEEAEVLRDERGTAVRMLGTIQDITERVAAERERGRLVAAVEHTSDSVIVADLSGTIEYVNPAFEKASGYRRDEVVGQNPRILKSGRQSATFYRALWRDLTRGKDWSGTLINRRKDGSLYEEDATISPIRGPGGQVTGYIAVKRDVTALRSAESSLSREFRERAEVAASLARLQPTGSAEETASVICDELLRLPGMDVAGVINFLDPWRAIPLAVGGPDGVPFAAGQPLPATRAAYLYERAAQGPWAEAFRPRPEDGRYGEEMAEAGIRAIAFAPMRNGQGLLGVVVAGTCDETYARHLIDHLPAVGEFAATASALLSRQLERGRRDELVRKRIRRAQAEGGLWPVFQPILALGSTEPIGYEALTRFADGMPPDRMISQAYEVALGIDLEIACLRAALDAAEALPQDAWLSLNASPDVILHSADLPRLLRGRSRRIVLEITEHAQIDDYVALRDAVAALGPTVSLSVDDAGSGFASLRHVVELKPRFLKLDISLVHHVDRDTTRQAMIAGMRHFAERVGCEVIAEGIEEQAELDMLRELGVPLGQGYLLGRPEPLPPPGAAGRTSGR
jgi:PAS domain S-box-containing protein